MCYGIILAIFWYLKSFISNLHEIYKVASQKFKEFGNECPRYTPGKALCMESRTEKKKQVKQNVLFLFASI